MSGQEKNRAELHYGEGEISLNEMHDIADVCMSSIHLSFAGKSIDGRAFASALLGLSLGILRDMDADDPKAVAHEFINSVDISEITPFSFPADS